MLLLVEKVAFADSKDSIDLNCDVFSARETRDDIQNKSVFRLCVRVCSLSEFQNSNFPGNLKW